MTIPRKTRIRFKSERINTPKDLIDLDEDSISEISDNLRIPGGRVTSLTPGSISRHYSNASFHLWSEVSDKLIVACHLVSFYEAVGTYAVSVNIFWGAIIKNFQWP